MSDIRKVVSPELETIWSRSTGRHAYNCSCCDGRHVTNRWAVAAGSYFDVSAFVSQALTDLPEGATIQITVETVEPSQPETPEGDETPFILRRPKPGDARLVVERDGQQRVVGSVERYGLGGWLALNWFGTSLGSAETMREAAWMVWDEGKRNKA